jgi:hypothetical protein
VAKLRFAEGQAGNLIGSVALPLERLMVSGIGILEDEMGMVVVKLDSPQDQAVAIAGKKPTEVTETGPVELDHLGRKPARLADQSPCWCILRFLRAAVAYRDNRLRKTAARLLRRRRSYSGNAEWQPSG